MMVHLPRFTVFWLLLVVQVVTLMMLPSVQAFSVVGSSSNVAATFSSSSSRSASSSTRRMMTGESGEENEDEDAPKAKDSTTEDDDEEFKTSEFSRRMTDPNNFPTFMDDEAKVRRALGLDRGAVLLAIVLVINAWFFTIPVEFRRTRLCSEMDTAAYPEQCMTPNQFAGGIADYYREGGGIKWDFSVAKDNPFVASD